LRYPKLCSILSLCFSLVCSAHVFSIYPIPYTAVLELLFEIFLVVMFNNISIKFCIIVFVYNYSASLYFIMNLNGTLTYNLILLFCNSSVHYHINVK
jgi:hypothetical protein